MILVFEGMDRVGKTTTINALNRITAYEFPSMDRGPAGFIVYDKLLERNCEERFAQNLRDAETLAQGDVLFIYLKASESTIEERLKQEGATLPGGTTVQETLKVYEDTIKEIYPRHKTRIYDTTLLTTDDILVDILNCIDEMHRYWPLDLHIKEVDHAKDRIYFYPSHNVIPEKLFELLPNFNAGCDPAYYNMIYAALDHTMFKHETGWLNERQLVVHSDECIPCVQIIISDKKFIIDVKQRSLNIRKHYYDDLTFFHRWYHTSKFCKKYIDKNLKFVVNYDIAFPHSFPY